LLSDFVPGDSRLRAEDAFAAALDLEGVEVVQGQVRIGQRGGWDARRARPKTYQPIIRAGSVLLLRSSSPLQDLRPRLAELEVRGVGKLREEGLGWIRFSDPVHSPEWRTL
jgi:hypothetical protein